MNGADILVESLIREGVTDIFAYPGGASMEMHQSLAKAKDRIRTILPRHEQGGSFAAEGYARATGKPGVCMATSGPGATNLMTAIADAFMDSTPLVCITGQVYTKFIGKAAFQETDFFGMTLPVVKHSYLVMDIKDLAYTVKEAFKVATTGRPGPVVVDKITELLPKTFHLGAIGLDRGCGQILSELFSRIHKEMVQMGSYYEECRGMGATLSLCWLTPSVMHFGHVGDSRIYYLPKEGEFTQITEDHTHVGYLVRQGKITEYEARTRRDRNILDQALGGNVQRIDPQIGSVVYSPGDRFVLCTDGVTDGISNRRIHSLVDFPPASLEPLNPAERLVIDAKQESGRDNITALVLELG